MHHIRDQIVLMDSLRVCNKANCECADVSICALTINVNVSLNQIELSQSIDKVYILCKIVCKNI